MNAVNIANLSNALRSNIIQRYNSLYNKLPKTLDFKVELLSYNIEIINYRTTSYKCYAGLFALTGNKELINLAYESGIGSKCGLGLGVIEKIN